MSSQGPLPNPLSQPLDYFYQNWTQEWAVISGAPMSVSVLVLLACIGTWIIFHFLHKRQLDRIPLLEERIRAKDEKIAELEKRPQSLTPPTSIGAKMEPSQGHGQPIIHSAEYGLGPDKYVNLTEAMRELINKGEQHLRVEPGSFGIQDPYPGDTKHLRIVYSYGTEEKKTLRLKDYDMLNLPNDLKR